MRRAYIKPHIRLIQLDSQPIMDNSYYEAPMGGKTDQPFDAPEERLRIKLWEN